MTRKKASTKGGARRKASGNRKTTAKRGVVEEPEELTEAQRRDQRIVPYQWKKGHKGHGGGRPRLEKSLTKILRDQLDKPAKDFELICRHAYRLGLPIGDSTVGEVLSMSLIHRALSSPSPGFTELIFNRMDGKVGGEAEGGTASEKAVEIRGFLAETSALSLEKR